MREREKDKKDKRTTSHLMPEVKNKLGLPSDIDFMGVNPKNPFFFVRAYSPEEAKKKIEEHQPGLEKGYGIKIDLEKLEIEE